MWIGPRGAGREQHNAMAPARSERQRDRRDALEPEAMGSTRPTLIALAAAGVLLLAACGSSTPAEINTPVAAPGSIPAPAPASTASARLLVWPEFGLNPQRSDSTEAATGITRAELAHLRAVKVSLPGTVDSSPVYLHGASVEGSPHNAIFVTTTYGRTLAIDADSGRIMWTFTPAGYSSWAGTAQITVSSPLIDPGLQYIYAASPNGEVHKLRVQNGSEVTEGAWPARITREPKHEKTGPALNIDGPYILAATGGYIGDIPPYQGHVVLINRASGQVSAPFNTLCANRRELILPSTCPASDSAILSRAGAVVEPGGARILIDTGNGPWNGSTDFGDSVMELTVPGLRLRQSFTPTNQEQLNTSDTDLGSSAPALLGQGRVILAGKDGILRVLKLSKLDGHAPGSAAARRHPLGGEVQRLSIPGGGELWTAPAVWTHGGRTTVFIADEHATAAYVERHGDLYRAWENSTPGTSPVLAGGLLYVYEPNSGGINVYQPGSATAIFHLPGEPGHWNSPIVLDGHVIEPSGNANEHKLSGSLEIFSVG